MTDDSAPRLTTLARGGGCGCKISPDILGALLGETPAAAPRDLLVDAATRDDAAVWRLSDDQALIATTDFFSPVVDDPFDFGRIAAANALSDVYAMGGRPIFCLAILAAPLDRLPQATIAEILAGGRAVCEAAGAPIAGGHSIDAAEPIYGLAALGLAHPKKILRNSGAREGDVLILGKALGVGVFSAALRAGALGPEAYATMVASTTRLNVPGAALAGAPGVHAMTDVTGFGLLGHLAELCRAGGASAIVDAKSVPVFAESAALLRQGFRTGASARNWRSVAAEIEAPPDWPQADRDMLCDPQTSGGLLVACAPEAADAVLEIFKRHGHDRAALIGRVAAGPVRIRIV